MAQSEKPGKKTTPPRGGRKGGTLFPKINLAQAVDYARKLVAKTHTGPQPASTVLPGVFGSATSPGRVRASALKQFGLLEGGTGAYEATQLARKIEAAPVEELGELLKAALLSSRIFKQIFDTYHGDTVSKAKIKQQAQALDVHPESAEECAGLFMESAVSAGLATVDGDTIVLAPASEVSVKEGEASEGKDTTVIGAEPEPEQGAEPPAPAASQGTVTPEAVTGDSGGRRVGVAVTINVDSSSDPEKLEKQLKLLRQFGVI